LQFKPPFDSCCSISTAKAVSKTVTLAPIVYGDYDEVTIRPAELSIVLTPLRGSARWKTILEWYGRAHQSDEDVNEVLSSWWVHCHQPRLDGDRIVELFRVGRRAGLIRDDPLCKNHKTR
jgi:hypothetical protein